MTHFRPTVFPFVELRHARTAFFIALVVSLSACPTDDAECARADDCGETSADCASCPPRGEQLCLEGACRDRGADAVSVEGTINITPRQLEVGSVVHVLASATTATGALTCAGAFSDGGLADDVNVIAAGVKTLSGGSFHPDVSLGRVPEGTIAVLLLGYAEGNGEGAVIARGCETDLEAAGETLVVDLLSLEGDS